MSHFSEQLQDALKAADMTQAELSDAARVSQSSINRYLSGDITPPVETFGSILDALPETVHYDLIIARLTDELPKDYRDVVTILANGGSAVKEPRQAPYGAKLSSKMRDALEYLAAEAVQHQEVRDLILSLARALGAEVGNSSSSALDDALAAEERRRSQDKRDRKSS